MDPLTAVCNLANAALNLAEKIIDKQPPEVAAELWKMYMEDARAWRAFWASLGIGPKA